jgi:(p)ppGpp synthase/HD superfamily hydrolase
MSDQEPKAGNISEVFEFHREFAAAWARYDGGIRQRLQRQGVDGASIDVITRRMHQHVIHSGMTSSSSALEDVVAVLLFRLLELETSRHSAR